MSSMRNYSCFALNAFDSASPFPDGGKKPSAAFVTGFFLNTKKVEKVSTLPPMTEKLSSFVSSAQSGNVRQYVKLENCRKYSFTDTKSGLLKQGLTLSFTSGTYGEIQPSVEKGCGNAQFSASSELLGNIDVAYDNLGTLPRSVVIELLVRKDSLKLVNLWFASDVGGAPDTFINLEEEGGN